jgi:hypothetical protein
MLKKRSLYNLISGLLGQLVITVIAILVPRLVLVNLGSESNGLLNSVNQALVYLSLLEIGVGTVTVQALYKPIADRDQQSINGILSATNLYYRKTGLFYTLSVAVFAIVYPIVVETELSSITVVLVILFSGLAGALNYFFQGKYRLLLQAEGKGYVTSNLNTITHILINLGKIALLLAGYDVVELQAWYFILSAIQMIYIAVYIKRHYSWLDLSVKPAYDDISQKNSVLIHQICGLIFNNTDTLILTIISGLKVVSVYSLYNLIYTQIANLSSTLTTGSIMFALGQTYSKDRNQFIRLFDMYELYSITIYSMLFTILYMFMLPFLRLYTDGVTDINYINTWYNILFCAVFLLSNLRAPAQTVITVAGHFEKTKKQAIIEAIINLVVTLSLAPTMGIYGALIGTVAALLYRTNDMILYSNKNILKRGNVKTYRRIIRNLIIFIAVSCLENQFLPESKNYYSLFMSAVFIGTITLIIFIVINFIAEKSTCLEMWHLLFRESERTGKSDDNI